MPPKRARSSAGASSSSRAKRRPLAPLPLVAGVRSSAESDALTVSDAETDGELMGTASHMTADAPNVDSATVLSTTATFGDRNGSIVPRAESASFLLTGAVVGSVGAVEREVQIMRSRAVGVVQSDVQLAGEDYDVFPQSEVAGMVVELKRRAEKEKVLRRELHEARRQISDVTIASTRIQGELEVVKESHKASMLAEASKLAKLSTKLKFLSESEEKAQKQSEDATVQMRKMVKDNERKLEEVQHDNGMLSAQLEELKEASRARESQLSHDLQLVRGREATALQEISSLEEQLDALTEQLENSRIEAARNSSLSSQVLRQKEKINQLERRLQQAMASDPDSFNTSLRDSQAQASIRERDLRTQKAEIQTLRAQLQSQDVLQEKIMSLNRKVERHDQLRADLASTQTKTLQLNQQIEDWNQMAASVLPDANGPKSVADAVKRLQREQLLLTAKSGTVDTVKRQADTKLSMLQDHANSLETEVAQGKQHCKTLQQQAFNLKAELSSVVGSRDRLKALLDSYDTEDLQMGNAGDSEQVNKQTTVRIARMQDLEESLQQEEKRCLALREENENLQSRLIEAEAAAGTLEDKIGRGEYDPTTTKVLHMKANPQRSAQAAAKQKKLTLLRDENELLKKRILAYESGEVSAAQQVSVKVSESADSLENISKLLEAQESVQHLTTRLEAEKKLQQRLQQVYRNKVSQFRSACYELTGYKIQMGNDAQEAQDRFTLRSMYAEKADDTLTFKQTGQGGYQVLETPFCRRLDKATLEVLTRFNSIPAFLASVTLKLFENQTQI